MTFYILILISIILTIYSTYKTHPINRLIALLICWGISVVGLFFYSAIVCHGFIVERDRINHRQDLFSLKLNHSYSGEFLLGSGSFEGAAHYYYYIKDEDGFFVLKSTPTYNVRIKQIPAEDQPYISYQTINYGPAPIMFPFNVISRQQRTIIDMFIPEKSIITEFNPN